MYSWWEEMLCKWANAILRWINARLMSRREAAAFKPGARVRLVCDRGVECPSARDHGEWSVVKYYGPDSHDYRCIRNGTEDGWFKHDDLELVE